MAGLDPCPHCGAVMGNVATHLAWHLELLTMVETMATGARKGLEELAKRDARLAERVREAFARVRL